ncbi:MULTISPECIES: SPOR domain-containing protein [unclassified Cupriavidus]|uniref:SPOR domain-containing protein n=1 Tax=unclassified Cupriavidus TaxID=2640874 RepID=UPI00136569AC|nr:SPOR domain-containing protein [Cupriavidus sp. SW-Y-13]MWL85904.1 SPOR domain-containing protein [Cupriavidus sp. SW-Y-13]
MSRKGLNVLLIALLVANALLLAALLGAFGPQPFSGLFESPREPQRVDQQVRGERMELQPRDDASAPAATPAPRSATPGKVTLASTSAPVRAEDSCMEMGGFTAQSVAHAREDLVAIAAGSTLPVDQFERSEQVRWWVHLPAQATRENADRKLAELRRRKVTDVSVVSNEEAESFTVSLGLFRERERADRFLESLRGQGVRTALISDAPRNISRQWLRVATTDEALRARMEEVRQRYGAEVMQACKGGMQARVEGAARG